MLIILKILIKYHTKEEKYSKSFKGGNILFEEVISTIFRSIAAILVLILLARINGAKQISQMSFYDYVIGISIGSMAAIMAIDAQVPFYLPCISIATFTFINYLEGKCTLRSISLRRIMEGTPLMLIEDGNLIQKNIKKAQLTINDLLSEARLAGFFNLNDIAYAIMEINGKISFLPYLKQKECDKKEVLIRSSSLLICVIIDGIVLDKELTRIKKDTAWLLQECSNNHYDLEDILLAVADIHGKLFIWKKHYVSSHDQTFI